MITKYGTIPQNELTVSEIPSFPNESLSYVWRSLNDSKFDKRDIAFVKESPNFYFLKSNGKLVKIPKFMTPKLAYVIGYFYGDSGLKDIYKSYKTSGSREYKMKIADELNVCLKEKILIILNLQIR